MRDKQTRRLFEGTFVTLVAQDGLELDALWVPGRPSTRIACIHLHGKGGNFYTNGFLRHMYTELPLHGIGILGVATRGSGAIMEAYQNGEVTYVGSAYELLVEAKLDIECALSFCENEADITYLQGHSHGCEKIYQYTSFNPRIPMVLISPADSAELHRQYSGVASFGEQRARLAQLDQAGLPWGLAPDTEYGVTSQGITYRIPMASSALQAWLASGIHSFDQRVEKPRIATNPAMILMGACDVLQCPDVNTTCRAVRARFPKAQYKILADSDHHFHGHEEAMVEEVAAWVKTLLPS